MYTYQLARRKSIALGAVLGVAMLALTASPARADDDQAAKLPPAGTADLVDAQDPNGHQNRLTDLKTWILQQPGLESSGYIESVNDAASLSTTLLWHGAADDVQRAVIAEGARRGITVTVEQRKFSLPQLQKAVASLTADGADALPGFELNTAITVSADFDGVRLIGEPTATATKKQTVQGEGVEKVVFPEVAKQAAEQLGVAVTAELGGEDVTMAATRPNDTPAFNAGGMMYSPSTGSGCSSGFSVKVGSTKFTMTARHCVDHDYRAYSGTAKYGDGVRNSTDGAARQMSATGSPLMFDGAYNDSSGYKKTVVGYGDVSLNDRVCTSGANSGVHCSINIAGMGATFDDHYPYVSNSKFSTIIGAQTGLQTAACQGDSGGPVLLTAGSGKVKAVGMIQGGKQGSGYDTTSPTRMPAQCSRWVYFSAMRTIVNTLPSASLVTG